MNDETDGFWDMTELIQELQKKKISNVSKPVGYCVIGGEISQISITLNSNRETWLKG